MRKILRIAGFVLWAGLSAVPAQAQDALPPSAAVKLAVAANPGAKPLGVKLSGGIYVVRLRQDGTIILVGVDPATGDVFPLQ